MDSTNGFLASVSNSTGISHVNHHVRGGRFKHREKDYLLIKILM